MVDLLPPVARGDIATKRNVQAEVGVLRSEMQAGFAEPRSEMQTAHSELLLKLFFGLVASNATLVGLVVAATRLGGRLETPSHSQSSHPVGVTCGTGLETWHPGISQSETHQRSWCRHRCGLRTW
jgi:hypothetical protein